MYAVYGACISCVVVYLLPFTQNTNSVARGYIDEDTNLHLSSLSDITRVVTNLRFIALSVDENIPRIVTIIFILRWFNPAHYTETDQCVWNMAVQIIGWS